jgi:2-haloalkanoic acid dehalogenase type II
MSEFDQFKALSFDCYGTLIDWETGMSVALRDWADRADLDVSDGQLLEWVSELETVIQGEQSPALLYPEVLAEVLRRIGTRLGVSVSGADATGFGASVGEWPAFPDSTEALERLAKRFKLVIVSNVDRQSFAASNGRLGVVFDKVITAQDVGAYKPRLPHFDALFESLPGLGVERNQLLHVAQSLFHDHEPAQKLGLPSVWIDRRHDREGLGATPAPSGDVQPNWRFPSLSQFADAVGA